MDYDREWTTKRGLPACSRLHVGLTTNAGSPVRFLIQLEYWHAGGWLPVARADHDVDGPAYRDVERSGLHFDLYDPDGHQFAKLTDFLPQPADDAMGDAEDFIRANAEHYVRRFEAWL